MTEPRPKTDVEYADLEAYYRPQFRTPYENIAFLTRVIRDRRLLRDGDVVLDMGGGVGVVSFWLSKAFPNVRFVVRDYDRSVVEIGRRLLDEHGAANVNIAVGDWYALAATDAGRYTGVFNVGAFCCLKEAPPAIRALTALQPSWLILQSLFWDGPLDVLVHIRSHLTGNADYDPDGDFNIFSLPLVRGVFAEEGYPRVTAVPFEIGIDIPKRADGRRGTYTIPLGSQPRAQFSGPVYLPWHAVVAERGDAAR